VKTILSEPQGRVLRALNRVIAASPGLDRQLPSVLVESIDTVDWASLTFAGQRHRMTVMVSGMTVAEVPSLAALDLGTTIVAEARVASAIAVGTGVELIIEVMTIDTRL